MLSACFLSFGYVSSKLAARFRDPLDVLRCTLLLQSPVLDKFRLIPFEIEGKIQHTPSIRPTEDSQRHDVQLSRGTMETALDTSRYTPRERSRILDVVFSTLQAGTLSRYRIRSGIPYTRVNPAHDKGVK